MILASTSDIVLGGFFGLIAAAIVGLINIYGQNNLKKQDVARQAAIEKRHNEDTEKRIQIMVEAAANAKSAADAAQIATTLASNQAIANTAAIESAAAAQLVRDNIQFQEIQSIKTETETVHKFVDTQATTSLRRELASEEDALLLMMEVINLNKKLKEEPSQTTLAAVEAKRKKIDMLKTNIIDIETQTKLANDEQIAQTESKSANTAESIANTAASTAATEAETAKTASVTAQTAASTASTEASTAATDAAVQAAKIKDL